MQGFFMNIVDRTCRTGTDIISFSLLCNLLDQFGGGGGLVNSLLAKTSPNEIFLIQGKGTSKIYFR